MDTPKILSVSEAVKIIKESIQNNDYLNKCTVRGEVIRVSRSSTGAIYFELKDDRASLRCAISKWQKNLQQNPPRESEMLDITGKYYISDNGAIPTLYAATLTRCGSGDYLEELRRRYYRLRQAGWMEHHKHPRPLPQLTHTVGVATAAHSAALADIIKILRQRNPGIRIIHAPCSVQGEKAPAEIMAALKLLEGRADIQVIILGRGGGSLNDLQCFNDEELAIAVAQCSKPVICGVGHEIDHTLCEYTADLRANTPTNAAELAVPYTCSQLKEDLNRQLLQLQSTMRQQLERLRQETRQLRIRLHHLSPRQRLNDQKLELEILANRITVAMEDALARRRLQLNDMRLRLTPLLERRLAAWRRELSLYKGKVQALNPLGVLDRGYALITDAEGHVVSTVQGISPGHVLDINMQDGSLTAQVTAVSHAAD